MFVTPAEAFIKRGGGAPPPPVVQPSNNGGWDLPEIVGLDIVGSTLTARMGAWSGSPTPTYTCSWHMIGGPTLGTNCASFGPLTAGQVGQYLQVDVTATSTNGITTLSSPPVTSWWVGPITSTARTLPPLGAGPAPTALPTYPGNIVENGHYLYPGCTPPNPAPTFTTGAHVWYFDSILGHTQDSGATGHVGDPFNSVDAIFGTSVTGYSGGQLFNRTIAPGDTIYIKADPSGAAVGNIVGSAYSTSDGTATGSTIFTWITKDPASAINPKDSTKTLNPVLGSLNLSASAGFVFDHINVEQTGLQTQGYASNGAPMARISGTVAAPTEDIYFENGSLTSWLGHSNDPASQSTYPTTGGASDGTIQTASPYAGALAGGSLEPQDPTTIAVTASTSTPTKLFLNSTTVPVLGQYVWSPGYYYQQGTPSFPVIAPLNTGIPNGTIVRDLQGRTNLTYKGSLASPPSGAGVLNDAWMTSSDFKLWICNSSACGGANPAWTDSGATYVTIAACDIVNDADTGCTQTPIQCDPRIPPAAGCVGNPPWTGVTRNLSGAAAHDYIIMTARMRILPAGWWNVLDWNWAQGGIWNVGSRVGSGNDIEGAQCINTKNNLMRWVNSHMVLDLMTNSTHGGNWLIYRAQDSIQVLSGHRLIFARNLMTDVSFDRGHPDQIQFAQHSGGNGDFLYGSAIVDNEFYAFTDPLNPFTFHTEGIAVTDQVYSGVYMGNNIIFNTTNPSGGGGLFWAIVHNIHFMDQNNPAGQLQVKSGAKANLSLPAQSLMANNVSNSYNRPTIPGNNAAPLQPTNFGGAATTCVSNSPTSGQYTVTMHVGGAGQAATSSWATGPNVNTTGSAITVSGFAPSTAPTMNGAYVGTIGNNSTTIVATSSANAGTCPTFTTEGWVTIGPASCSYDANTISNNRQVPSINYFTGTVGFANSNWCELGPYSTANKTANGNRAGVWNDMASWSNVDYRTTSANSLFIDFDPIPPDGSGSAGPGAWAINDCLRNEFNLGACAHGDQGALNLRPNPALVSTSLTINGQCTTTSCIPTSGAIGDKWLLQLAAFCNGGFPICGATFGPFSMPAGLYVRCATTTAFVPPCTSTTPSGTFAAYGATVTGGVLNANNQPFTPGLIGAGVDLGAQQPPADHGRRPWKTSPAAGVYEGP